MEKIKFTSSVELGEYLNSGRLRVDFEAWLRGKNPEEVVGVGSRPYGSNLWKGTPLFEFLNETTTGLGFLTVDEDGVVLHKFAVGPYDKGGWIRGYISAIGKYESKRGCNTPLTAADALSLLESGSTEGGAGD